MVVIANVVGTGDLEVELDVEAVKEDIEAAFTEHNPSNYHGLYIRLIEDGPLITVFRSGKYNISGCSSLEELNDSNRDFLQKLAALEIVEDGADPDFSVQNIVCTSELRREIDLNALSIGLGLEMTEYEPEQFPGLIYRPKDPTAVLLVFANGKAVITGISDIDTAESAFTHLQNQVQSIFSDGP